MKFVGKNQGTHLHNSLAFFTAHSNSQPTFVYWFKDMSPSVSSSDLHFLILASRLSKLVVVVTKFEMTWTKLSLKIGTAKRNVFEIFWPFRDYGLDHIFFRNETFLFSKIES